MRFMSVQWIALLGAWSSLHALGFGPAHAAPAASSLQSAPSTRSAPTGATQKRPLPVEDYDRWRRIESTSLSPDGAWLTYAYSHRVIEDTLTVHRIDDGPAFTIGSASDPVFSDDSRWLAYRIGDDAVGLLDLETGERTRWEGARSFVFARGARHLAVRKEHDPDSPHQGADLLVRDLVRGLDTSFGNVDEFEFNREGTLLGFTVDAAARDGNGVYLLRLASSTLETLDQSSARYARLTWDRSGRALAALRGNRSDGFEERENSLVAFRGLDGDRAEGFRFDPAEAGDFPAGMVVSERGRLGWKADLSMVFVGIGDQRSDLMEDPDAPRPDVDVFHWNDDRIQTVQRARADADRDFTYRAGVELGSGRFVRLTDPAMRTITLGEDGIWGVGRDDRAYVSDWEEERADYYRVDTSTGARSEIVREQRRTLGVSPDGTRFAYWRDGHVWVHALPTGETRNLTASAPISFVNEQYDHPGTKPPYGLAGWTADGRAMILNHRYDLWLQPLDGSPATDLTGGFGAANEVRLRILDLDPDSESVDLEAPRILSGYGEWTKKSGFFELSGGRLTERIFGDREYRGLERASAADRYTFTSSTFAEFPDIYASDAGFRSPRRITDANPQQAEYSWGHRILFEFENRDGVRLQGTLAIPDGRRDGERLPMLVNFYEKKSQELHTYYAPLFGGSYPSGNAGPVAEFGAYVSNGYLVMQLDVHFNTGTTHSDMLDCVTAATRKVIEMGYADPERIALLGGSFSGGGSAFIATQTDMFAAIASRAAPINLAGEFNILFSGSGENNHQYDIYGQGRYGTDPFDDFELYREQSPITHVRNMNTPLLYLHGKLDGSVEYLQGMEFYNALRFLGKPVIFLSYPEEGHNLRKYENQRDFTERLWQFLDHYLKDAPAPKWMTEGVPFLDRYR